MEIKRIKEKDFEVLMLDGRLDAYWADHLDSELSKAIREGIYKIRLDMSSVSYISSAGIRVLLQSYKQLKKINGEFDLVNISENVQSVLKLSGIDTLLKPSVSAQKPVHDKTSEIEKYQSDHASFDIHENDTNKHMDFKLIGDAGLLKSTNKGTFNTTSLKIPPDCYALGLGAFGDGYDDCRSRYGEFIALGGAVCYLPTDGSNVPDFHIASGSYVPDITTLYGIECRGGFQLMVRFETSGETGPVGLSSLVEAAFNISGGSSVAIAAIAETSGIVGANLIKSPVADDGVDSVLEFPHIQDCISFTSEKSYIGSLAVLFGVASKNKSGGLEAFLHPLGQNGNYVHFHSMIFSYEPLMKGSLNLGETVNGLFERQSLQTVIHLLTDDRGIIGAGESEFLRGGLWISSL